ncbi:polysaccharide pyruvyl transferase family protein [Winogradskyella alexanderae]|uniref:Polysaccharide pyruvyl transferase family protein n=1 Tax=Winogradskyella alexanderae TaxID=2877123 RepID=A0ABS7XP69_9FLAO|nr:polysaccharide pyruvyl transferase family protein [Winogradskyella alexanderae]MCA0131294.1 polysaccharide pyruvyl transferase family protein [Winogradskyella alexanderae]
MTKIKIGIRGAYGEQNFGDDALMLFLYKWSKKNNLGIKFIGNENEYISQLIPADSYIFKTQFHKNKFDILILGGGTQFFSFENSPKPTNKLTLLFTKPQVFFSKVYGALEKKLIYKQTNYKYLYAAGIGLGPFVKDSENEILAKEQLSKMQGLYVRDTYSFNFAKSINHNTFLGTDICFLPDIYDMSPYYNTSDKVVKVGIIVRDWNYSKAGQNYLSKIIKQARKISDAGYFVTFICFKNEPQCEELIDQNNFEKLKWDPIKNTLEDFIKELSLFDLFVSARFHGVIFGALLGVPSIAIEVEPKLKVTKELLDDGVEVWEQPFSSELLDIIQKLNYLNAKQSLKTAVNTQRDRAKEMFNRLLAAITK